ncbi:heme A synthase [Aquihabitans daechungensis]|uniref:COX15/CtaA family protein n=1 Tax=Aquihabitans daechungensis TaxID=1052257 RepID=UPI003B9E833D
MLDRLRQPVSPQAYRTITMVALVLLVAIVVTGAGVRLTGSGLGCSDWPGCTDRTFTPTRDLNSQIEFWNRMITGLVGVAVIVAVLGSLRRAPKRKDLVWLSWGLVAGVVAQALLGKLVVETHLNPWLVQGHMVLSLVLVANALVLTHRAGQPDGVPVRPTVTPALMRWGNVLVGLAVAVLLSGTLVTGSGPHSGKTDAPENATRAQEIAAAREVKRLPIAVHDAARIHGVTVMIFLAATIWVLVQVRRHQRDGTRLLATTTSLLTVLVLQAGIGYAQYFTGVPPLLVLLHIFGACLVWIAVLMVRLHMSAPLESGASPAAEWRGGIEHPGHLPDGDRVP